MGSNLSVDLMGSRVKAKLWSTFRSALGDLEGVVPSGALDKNALLELDAIDKGLPLGKTGDAQALNYAKALKVLRDKVFTMEQSRNPFLMKAQDYLWMQLHDQERIQAMGKDAWVDLAMKTFGDKSYSELQPDEKLGKFQEAYDKIVAGKWGGTLPEDESIREGSVLRRQAATRSWVAKDAQAFADYNSLAGPKTLYDGLNRIVSRSAQDIALLQKAGPTPDTLRDALLRRVTDSLSPDERQEFQSKKQSLDSDWRVVRGAQQGAARGIQAKLVQGGMTLEYLAKGGAAIFHAAPGDLSLGGNLLRQLDESNIVGHTSDLAAEYLKSLAPSYRAERADDLGLFLKSARNEVLRAFGAPDGDSSRMAKLAQTMGTLSGYNTHVEAMQSAIGTVLSRMLGRESGTEFAGLHPSWQQGLQRYGIGGPEWNVLRSATIEVDGRTHLTPEAIQDLPREQIAKYLTDTGQVKGAVVSDAAIQRARDDLDIKLGSMINEHALLGTAHADTRQRAFLLGDTNINQGMGQLRRMMAQFKQATAVTADIYRRGYFSGTKPGGDVGGVISHAVLAIILTGVADALVQTATTGKTPENPVGSVGNAAKLMIGSGAAGIFGSMLQGEMEDSRGWQDKSYAGLKGLAGPVIGTALDAGGIARQAIQDAGTRKSQAPKAAVKLGMANVPGQNLIFFKAALDYLFTHQIMEAAGPGYLHQLEHGAAQSGQKYLFAKPTGKSFFQGDR